MVVVPCFAAELRGKQVVTITEWLASLGMPEYAERFTENDIDVSVLRHLTDQDLKELGVSLGHRRKMLAAIAELSGAAPATPQTAGPPAPKPRDDAERRQLTVMFTDLVGSTALSTKLDPEDLRAVIGAYHKCVAEAVARLDGFVAKYMGDGVLIYFGYPQAHEDDAERAVRAGLVLIEAVGKLRIQEPLQVRIGIATGLVVVGDLVGSGEAQERGVVGETPNLAARLQEIAAPNTVVIAEATRRLLGNLFELEDLGAKDVKGIGGRTRVWAVLRASSVESRFEALHTSGLTALVGREEESELLLRRWANAKTGEGQVVLIAGEAGIGKSRLTAALMESLSSEPHTCLRYFCSPQHTDSALYPIIGQMERAAGFAHDDTPQARLDKLDAVLGQISTSIEDAALFAEMLSLPNDARYPALELAPQQRRERTFKALVSQIEVLTRKGPVLMIFEDAHWIDPTSLESLGRVVDRIQTFRVLLIVTFRSEFNPPWIGRPHVTAVTINRLTQRQAGAMINGVVGNKLLAASVRQDIIERTDGIPLFVEEMTKAVMEVESEGEPLRAVAAVQSPALAVPASLHASLMARLDRLGPAKEVAQIGAAIGREFSHELLASVVPKAEAELGLALDRLIQGGLLFRQGVPPHASYLFKHALVQDAAYGTLLRSKRQELHGEIASALKQKFPDVIETQPELLAYHLSAAGETSRALEQWLTAGRYAAQRSAHVEAVAHFNRALALLASLPETDDRDRQEIEIQIARGLSLFTGRGFQSREAAEAYARATELCEASGDNRHLFTAVWNSWLSRSATGPMAAARNLSHKLLGLTEKQEDIGLRLQAHHSGWTTYFVCGAPARSREHCQLGVRLYDREKHRPHALLYGGHDPGVCARTFLATGEWLLGFPDAALASINSAVVLAEQLAHPLSLAMALLYAAIVHNFRREPKDAIRNATKAQALVTEHRLAAFVDPRVLQAAALAEQGQALEAFALLQKANVDDKESIAPIAHQSYTLGILSVILDQIGERAKALHTVDHALSLAEKSEAQWWDAEVYRIKGSLLLSRQESASSEASFRRSIDIAQQQEARSIELRAATGLARLWCDHGKRIEARDLLSPVYNWFTEGLDTPDLREAKVLLEQLSA